MSDIARDSGIIADDESSDTSSMRAYEDYRKLTYVQKLKKQFELLATEAEREFHANTNWWLDDEEQPNEDEHSEENDNLRDSGLDKGDEQKFEHQISVSSERSHKSLKSQLSNKSQLSEKSESPQRKFVPQIILSEYDDDNKNSNNDVYDDSFESADDIDDEENEQKFVRKSQEKLTSFNFSRPTSITSQVSK